MMLWAGGGVLLHAEEAHYDRLLRVEEFKKYDKTAVHRIQQELANIYRDDPDFLRDVALGHKPLTDDIIGPVTLFWMQRFCYTFKIQPIGDFSGGLVASISSFSAFATSHPKEKAVILLRDFGRWVDAQTSSQKNIYYAVRRSGTDAQRIDMVDQYLKGKPGPQNAPIEPKDNDQRIIYTYRLDPEDIEILRGKPDIMKGLVGFPSKPFAELSEFDAAVMAALKDIPPDIAKLYLPMIERAAKVDGYRITDASLQRLQDVSVPDDLVDALKAQPPFEALYPEKADLEDALKVAVANSKTTASLDKYQDQIIAAAEIGTYSLDQSALKKLSDALSNGQKKPIIPIPVINILAHLENVNYPAAALFDKSVQAKISQSIGACPANTPDYATYLRSLMLKEPDYQALQKSVAASVAEVDAKQGDELNKKFETVDALRKFAAVCATDQTVQGDELAAIIYKFYSKAIIDVSKKAPQGKSAPISWSGGSWGVKGGAITSSCGCLVNDLSGVVYAFFPFWLDAPQASTDPNSAKGDKKPAEQRAQILDFNVLSRIGFVGFTFDDKGNLTQSVGRNDNNYDFTQVAHTFQTQMDWVIRKDDWTAWLNLSEQEQISYFNNLIVNILDLLKKTDGNGVTLFFDGYPGIENGENGDAVIVLDQFIDALSKRLRTSSKAYGLNIVLKQPRSINSDNQKGAIARMNSYQHMLKLLGLINPDESRGNMWTSGNKIVDWAYSLAVTQPNSKSRNHLLVLMEEPTTSSKKRLRLEIEQAVHGEERHQLLSGIIPVIEFDGRNWEQLEDDIIYFKDNFDGIGFWPASFHQQSVAASAGAAPLGGSHCNHGETVEQCLVKNYQGSNLNGVEDNVVDKFVCQFHMWFRVLFFILLVVSLIAYLVPIFTCYLRGWQERNFKLLIINSVLLGLVGLLLFAWDPALEGTNAHLFIMTGLAILVGVEAFRRHYDFVARTVKPSRAKEALVNTPLATDQENRQSPEKNGETMPTRAENIFHKKVLKSIACLKAYLNRPDSAQGNALPALKNDLNRIDDYLGIVKQERTTMRNKIRKSMQIVVDNSDGNDAAGMISKRKIQRVMKLICHYLNRNIPQERELIESIQPVMDQLDSDAAFNNDELASINTLLGRVREYLDSKDKNDTDTFNQMDNALKLMAGYLGRTGPQQTSSRADIQTAMQAVWDYLGQDQKLHGANQTQGSAAALPEMAADPRISPVNDVGEDSEPPIVP